jgi:predicted unusual protein kinase regulating ubiquinone biosynthesis (AarF/ABC1/UbiB family)
MTDDSLDQRGLAGRFGRYARVSGAAGELAMRLAGERYLGLKINRDRYAQRLTELLSDLKGPLVKVAQLAATVPGLLPPEFVEHLSSLRANAPPMGWSFVRRRMRTELGEDWEKHFRRFDKSSAAASLGQVHKAESLDGRALACKLQYPGLESTVEGDLKQLSMAMDLFERYDGSISTSEVYAEIADRVREELDYLREARQTTLFAEMLAQQPDVGVPEVDEALTTRRLLTMTWLDGEPLMDYVASHPEDRDRLAASLYRAWYRPLFECGVLHGDPHPGNYKVGPDGTLKLYDFGCIRVFSPALVRSVLDLYRAMRDDDEDRARHAYESWGFGNLTPEVTEALNIWGRYIFKPFVEDKTRTLHDPGDPSYGMATAMEVHDALRKAGGVHVPRAFVIIDRAAISISGVMIALGAELNWHRLFEEVSADFEADRMAERQRTLLEKHGLGDAVV